MGFRRKPSYTDSERLKMTSVDKEKYLAWLEGLELAGNQYKFHEKIGEGNSSEVFKATGADGKQVAIKIQEQSDSTLESIYEEFQILRETCCGNPHFPIFIGAYRTVDIIPKVWFVMELCEEGSVGRLLSKLKSKEQALPENVIAFIIREVVLSMRDLHEQSIIHRDLKASNILVTRDGDIKLCDFGLSKRVEGQQGVLKSMAGSPYHLAPEIIKTTQNSENSYDARADVWSLGILAVELSDCITPLSDVHAPRAVHQILQNPPPTLIKPSAWSQILNDFISECLEKNPDHRPWIQELIDHPFIKDITVEAQEKAVKTLLQIYETKRNLEVTEQQEITIMDQRIKIGPYASYNPTYKDDIATLDRIKEEDVMEILNQRFAQGNIYTYVGDVLLSINPYHEYPIYNSEISLKYRYRARCDNAPHIFAVGDRAFQDMMHHQMTQNILFTGETGSGKTYAKKQCLWHLVSMTAANKKMLDRIMKLPTIVEAFGNAETLFNTNSTRHIEYTELTFTKSGKLSGAILYNYCLEKWRVTSCGRNQSNFHIFYYLVDGLAETGESGNYHLEKGKTYEYLRESPSHAPRENVSKFNAVKEAFDSLEFSHEELNTIVKILAAILLCGQIHFTENDEKAQLVNQDIVEKIAELLGVEDSKKLAWTFTHFCLVSEGEAKMGNNTVAEAMEARDSLARSLYCRLVDWIVNVINTKLTFTRLVFGDKHSLGLIDMPGFECFAQDNTLDQFLVNMINEQIQFFHNQRVFMMELDDYEKEEMSSISYSYHDNRELLDMVLSKPTGLLAFLDQETKGGSNDIQAFHGKVEEKLLSPFIKVSDKNSGFTVAHYSGQVVYDSKNFIERNKNFLSPEIIELMRQSKCETVVQLFKNLMTKTGNLTIKDDDVKQTRWTSAITTGNSGMAMKKQKYNTSSKGMFSQSRQMQTIASTMRNSLLEMFQKVAYGSPHFVRCIRSNLKSEPFNFDRDLIRFQLRAMGLMETIRIRKYGYARRLRFGEFLKRYKFLAFDFDENVEETRENCRLLLIRLKMEDWALGKNKVFLKYYNEEFLSRLYENQVNKVVKVQAMMRAFLSRVKTNSKYPRLAQLRQSSVASKGSKGASPQASVADE